MQKLFRKSETKFLQRLFAFWGHFIPPRFPARLPRRPKHPLRISTNPLKRQHTRCGKNLNRYMVGFRSMMQAQAMEVNNQYRLLPRSISAEIIFNYFFLE